jgi:gamma-glutamylcyclotransferase (GGCT)/AIG2-like uncharacterized protein YtfP
MASCNSLPPFRLFTYGTLMVPEVMSAVCRTSFPAEKAVLAGFSRYGIKNEVFPAIIEKNGARTDGLLYRGISRKAIERLDAFEGDIYCRKEVKVTLTDGCEVCCLTYVLKDQHRHLLSGNLWNVDLFRDRHLAAYLARLYAK